LEELILVEHLPKYYLNLNHLANKWVYLKAEFLCSMLVFQVEVNRSVEHVKYFNLQEP